MDEFEEVTLDAVATMDRAEKAIARLLKERAAMQRRFAMLEDVLEEIKEYLADREDADHVDGRFIPNKEMSLLVSLKRALGEDI